MVSSPFVAYATKKAFLKSPGFKKNEKTKKEIERSPEHIYFESKDRKRIWIFLNDILLVKSCDHYIQAIAFWKRRHIEVSRHFSLKEFMRRWGGNNFIQLNKFYLLNRNQFSSYDEKSRILIFKSEHEIKLEHPIDTFVRRLLVQ